MVWVPEKGGFCIDRWEASLVRLEGSPWPSNQPIDRAEPLMAVSVPARLPQGYISGRQAAQACERAEKRLCSLPEWKQACRGPRAQRYPYGNERRAQVCNDRFKILDRHPVARLFKQYAPAGAPASLMWTSAWMNDPRLHELSDSVAETGSFEGCSSDYGVFDMVGNLHEWVADPEGTFAGGFFMDTYQNGEGCDYRTTGHSFDYHDYSTGFRCCKNALEAN
jgi:formylglycine-generating enzyme required for sulfatase activity